MYKSKIQLDVTDRIRDIINRNQNHDELSSNRLTITVNYINYDSLSISLINNISTIFGIDSSQFNIIFNAVEIHRYRLVKIYNKTHIVLFSNCGLDSTHPHIQIDIDKLINQINSVNKLIRGYNRLRLKLTISKYMLGSMTTIAIMMIIVRYYCSLFKN